MKWFWQKDGNDVPFKTKLCRSEIRKLLFREEVLQKHLDELEEVSWIRGMYDERNISLKPIRRFILKELRRQLNETQIRLKENGIGD